MPKKLTNPHICLVVPCHNEADTLRLFHQQVSQIVQNRNETFSFSFVNDGSKDQTLDILRELADLDPRVQYASLSRNFGKEAALSAGIDGAEGDAIIVMDSDLQHPPEMIPAMVDAWLAGDCQVVDCVKKKRGRESIFYKFAANIFNKIMSESAAMNLRSSSDFKLLDRSVVEVLRRIPERTRFFRGLTEWAGFVHKRIEFNVAERVGGVRSWSFKSLLRYSINNILIFSSTPLRLISALGMWTVLGSVILAIQTIVTFALGNAVEGFTTVILAISFFSGMILICLGIMGEYLARMYDELKARPSYIIAEKNQNKEGK